ncbi:MAG: ATP-binding protein [Vitreimonas sp.]
MTEDYEDLFDNAPCGYLSLDASGRIIKVNKTLLDWLGYDAGAIMGKRLHDLLNVAGRIFYETHFAPLLRMQGFFNEVALDFVTNSGARLPVLVNAMERKDEAGQTSFIRVTVFSATDRRRYEQELLTAKAAANQATADLRALNAVLETRVEEAVAERMKAEENQRQLQKMEAVGQLTGGIAHDFNNMLAVVIGALNLVEKRRAKGQDFSSLLAAALDGAQRAADLTKRLLAFSRRSPLSPKAVNINDIVSAMRELLLRTLGEHVVIVTDLADDLWLTRADPGQLENAILNLAINARDAMPDGGTITILTANAQIDETSAQACGALRAGSYATLSVRDSGVGMTPEVMARAFEPFFTTKEVGKGTGLGLSQIYGFVKQSGGGVEVQSEIGKGTTFNLYLPQHAGEREQRPPAHQNALAPLGEAHLVLLVEDDPRVREICAASLRELGCKVLLASTAAEALQVLRVRADISLLFTDIVMPDMNGRLLAREALMLRPDLKIVLSTGYARPDPPSSDISDQEIEVLSKPYTLEQLAYTLRKILSQDVA